MNDSQIAENRVETVTQSDKQMTNSEIRNAGDSLGLGSSISLWEVFELGVRVAERHHGIYRGKPQQR